MLLAAGVLLLLGRCDLTEPVSQQSLVVEAFVATGKALPPVTLRQTRPLDDPGNRRANAAEGATVELTLNGISVPYSESSQREGRYVPADGDT